jgi:hypothetical protein
MHIILRRRLLGQMMAVILFQNNSHSIVPLTEPPTQQQVYILQNDADKSNTEFSFDAFGRKWIMNMKTNNVLFGNQFSFDFIRIVGCPSRPTWCTTSLRNYSLPQANTNDVISGRLLPSHALPPDKYC